MLSVIQGDDHNKGRIYYIAKLKICYVFSEVLFHLKKAFIIEYICAVE